MTTGIVSAQRGPAVQKVTDVLAANGIETEVKQMVGCPIHVSIYCFNSKWIGGCERE